MKEQYAKLLRIVITILSSDDVYPEYREEFSKRADKLKKLTQQQIIAIMHNVVKDEDMPIAKLAILSIALRNQSGDNPTTS